LYPDRELPHFLDKNLLPQEAVAASALLTAMLERADTRIVARDVEGDVHFNAAFRNADYLDKALTAVGEGEYGPLVDQERGRMRYLYEEVFHFASFTVR